jgi:tRNA(Arg) A34 adenosine deaminase TadA
MTNRQKIIATTFDKKGIKIASAENSYIKTHTVQAKYAKNFNPKKIYLHAEILAIIRSKNRSISKIRIERFSKSGDTMLAKPCEICELAIKEAGIKFIEYTT